MRKSVLLFDWYKRSEFVVKNVRNVPFEVKLNFFQGIKGVQPTSNTRHEKSLQRSILCGKNARFDEILLNIQKALIFVIILRKVLLFSVLLWIFRLFYFKKSLFISRPKILHLNFLLFLFENFGYDVEFVLRFH